MPYITSVERIGRKKGLQEGKVEIFLQLLQVRFGFVPEPVREKVASANQDELTAWVSRIFQADSLQAVFQ